MCARLFYHKLTIMSKHCFSFINQQHRDKLEREQKKRDKKKKKKKKKRRHHSSSEDSNSDSNEEDEDEIKKKKLLEVKFTEGLNKRVD